jgi:hypothetical protein
MGLDQHAYTIKGDVADYEDEEQALNEWWEEEHNNHEWSEYEKRDAALQAKYQRKEIAYWRKHNRLQGWMEQLWRGKGNEGDWDAFNCVGVEITERDLADLTEAINTHQLPFTQGFFFGSDSYEGYTDDTYGYEKRDQEFIAVATQAIKDGLTVYYDCSW